jgi:hypothetical protein
MLNSRTVGGGTFFTFMTIQKIRELSSMKLLAHGGSC